MREPQTITVRVQRKLRVHYLTEAELDDLNRVPWWKLIAGSVGGAAVAVSFIVILGVLT